MFLVLFYFDFFVHQPPLEWQWKHSVVGLSIVCDLVLEVLVTLIKLLMGISDIFVAVKYKDELVTF